jgi:hypothetical protein
LKRKLRVREKDEGGREAGRKGEGERKKEVGRRKEPGLAPGFYFPCLPNDIIAPA